MITAEEFIEEVYSSVPYELEHITQLMIDFARLKVSEALKAASVSKSTYTTHDLDGFRTHPKGLNKYSVLNAYPPHLIK